MEVVKKMRENPLCLLDRLYLSYEMGIAKPSASFFLEILKEEGVSPQDSVFIDDRLDNIKSASDLGIKTLLYDNNKRCEAEAFFKEYLQ